MWTDGRDRLSLRYAVYETLVRYGPDGRYQPDLAAAWSVAEDAATWTFEIREGVRFHNGAPLTAQAVVASLDRGAAPGCPASWARPASTAATWEMPRCVRSTTAECAW